MSLSTRGASAARKPGVHYFSPVFDAQGYALAQEALAPKPAPQPKRLTEADWRRKPGNDGTRKSGAPSTAEIAARQAGDRINVPEEIRIFCDEYQMRLGCGRVLYWLWRARGELVTMEDLVARAHLAGTTNLCPTISDIRIKTARRFEIRNEPAVGYALAAEAVAALDALLKRRASPAGAAP